MPDIDTVVDGLGKGIDELIKPLVQALWDICYDTCGSCEGHVDWGRGYPWVDLWEPNLAGILALREALSEYNESHIPWILEGGAWDCERQRAAIELYPETGYMARTKFYGAEPIPLSLEAIEHVQAEIPLLAEFLRRYFLPLTLAEGTQPGDMSRPTRDGSPL